MPYLIVCKFLYMLTLLGISAAQAEVLLDPTRPPDYRANRQAVNATKTQNVPFKLTSTLISPQRRLATINGKTVGIGDSIGKARVIVIEPAKVELSDGNRNITLKLVKSGIKRVQ